MMADEPVGSIDIVDCYHIAGWVYDPQGDACSARLVIGGQLELPVTPGGARADVLEAGYAPHENVGYSVEFGSLNPADLAALRSLLDAGTLNVALRVRDTVVMSQVFEITPVFHITLEALPDGAVEGWVAAPHWPRPVSVELCLDGEPVERQRLVRVNARRAASQNLTWGASFSALFLAGTGKGPSRVTARIYGTIGQAEAEIMINVPRRVDRGASLALARASAPEASPVAIIVPVHNAGNALRRCLEALASHTTTPARLILVDDASTDPTAISLMDTWAASGQAELIRNRTNRGFTRSVNAGIKAAGRADVVLLNSDTRVAPRWLENLQLAARSAPDIGTVTAVSDNAGAFSVPDAPPNRRPRTLNDEQWARTVMHASALIWPEAPTGGGFCLYIRRACLDAVGVLDAAAFPRGYGEENDFCMRAGRLGWRHLIDDRTLVLHEGSASFGQEKAALLAAARRVIGERYPEYDTQVSHFLTGQPFQLVKARIRTRLGSGRLGRARPRVLYVISSAGGGTQLTNGDLMAGLAPDWGCWLLRSDGQVLTLCEVRGRRTIPVESVRLENPIDPVRHRSARFDAIVSEWLVAYGIELVHIRHLAWSSLGITQAARALSLPVILSFHDYYAACPTIKLLDSKLKFCGGRCTPDTGRDCQPDLWTGFDTPDLKNRWVHGWRENFSRALSHCDGFVTTSAAAKDLLTGIFPQLNQRPFAVIPHGRDLAFSQQATRFRVGGGDKLRVLLPGALTEAKGAALVSAMLDLGADAFAEFHVLGPAPELPDHPAITCHGPYERETFPVHAARIRPHIGAVLSIWPETWCHTLTELWAVGLPVLTVDIGAAGERVRASGAGWLIDPHDPDPAARATALLQAMFEGRVKLSGPLTRTLAWQESPEARRDCRTMAKDYAAFYRAVLDSRRPFSRPAGE